MKRVTNLPSVAGNPFSATPRASDESFREAVAALNVKAICELAPLVTDLSKYESFRHEAVGLALSIREGRYRSFAIK